MAIKRRNQVIQTSTPPQTNIERGDNIVVPAKVGTPVNKVAPIITGNTSRGSVLTVTPGVWENQLSLTITRAWFRDNIGIIGANGLTYVTVADDENKSITSKETAVSSGGVRTVSSNAVAITGSNGAVPGISSIPDIGAYLWKVGHKITGVPAVFTNADSVSNYWTRDNIVIPGATITEYTPVSDDIGKVIRFISRGTNASGSVEAVSAPSGIISAATGGETVDWLFDFTLNGEQAPTGVVVTRAGGVATRVNSALTLVNVPANFPRINNGINGPEGLLVEKSRTNILVNGRNPFGTGWATLGTGTMDDVSSADVAGGGNAGRLIIPGGAGYNGARAGVQTAPTTVLVQYYARSLNGAVAQLTGSDTGDVIGTAWNRYDKRKTVTGDFNLDFVNNSTASVNAAFFAVGVYPGGQIGESPIFTTGAPVTRAKETVQFQGPSNFFYDIRVRFSDGSYQDFLNQTVNGSWFLDADAIVAGPRKNCVRQVLFCPVGGLPVDEPPLPTPPPPAPGPAPAPSPSPSPSPSPAPNGVSTQPVDDATMLDINLRTAGWVGLTENNGYQYSASSSRYEGNEALMEGIGYLNSGFRNGAAHGFGRIWRRLEQPNGHIPGMINTTSAINESTFSNYMDPWMVFCHQQGFSGGVGWAEICKLSAQVQLKSTNKWYWVFHWNPNAGTLYRSCRIGWAPNWVVGPAYSQGFSEGLPNADRPLTWDATAGVAGVGILAGGEFQGNGYAGYACHFTFADAQFRYVDASDVKNFLIACQVRRGANSQPGHRGMIHLGMDPKLRSSAPGGGEYWPYGVFPPSSISQTVTLTNEWKPLYSAPWTATETNNQRVVRLSQVNLERPMYPF